MRTFFLFFKRDLKQIFSNPRLMILPLIFFGISLFLIHFMGSGNLISSDLFSLAWVLFILSTTAALGQTIVKDHSANFLQALQGEKVSLTPYIIAKALSLSGGWGIAFWLFMSVVQALTLSDFSGVVLLKTVCVIAAVSGALGFLYCFFDALFLQGKGSPFLGLVLLVPFILPLLILAFLSSEKVGFESLIPVMGYAVFLSFGAFLITHKIISR